MSRPVTVFKRVKQEPFIKEGATGFFAGVKFPYVKNVDDWQGKFLSFGIDDDGESIAIVEKQDGHIAKVDLDLIRFLD